MVQSQPCDGAFENILNGDALVVCYLTQNIAEVKSDRAREVNFEVLIILVFHYVVLIKLRKAGVNELIAIWLLEMLKNKPRETRKESTGFFFLVDFFQKLLPA